MIYRDTATIAKAFRNTGAIFHIEQRGNLSSVSVRLAPDEPVDAKTLRFISSESKTTAYIIDAFSVDQFDSALVYYNVLNWLNAVFPHMKFFKRRSILVGKYDIPSFIPDAHLGAFCFRIYEDVKSSYGDFEKVMKTRYGEKPSSPTE